MSIIKRRPINRPNDPQQTLVRWNGKAYLKKDKKVLTPNFFAMSAKAIHQWLADNTTELKPVKRIPLHKLL